MTLSHSSIATVSPARTDAPLFSVIVPTFNRARLLKAALDSVLAQRFEDYELIVADDGSTDATDGLLAEYDGKATILRQDNGGPAAARNLGARHARGVYLAFLDSDDLWFPWTLDTYAAVIERTARPVFLAGCPQRFSEERALVAAETAPEWTACADYLASGGEWRWYGVSSFVLSRAEFLRHGGFTETCRVGEDADLALRFGTGAGFVQVTSPATFGYRMHADNISASAASLLAGADSLVRAERTQAFPGGRARACERQRILARHVRPAALAAVRAGMIGRGLSLYRQTLPWQARAGAWKFVLGLPPIAAFHWLSRTEGR